MIESIELEFSFLFQVLDVTVYTLASFLLFEIANFCRVSMLIPFIS